MRHRAILAFSAALVAGCTPLHGWDAHTTSMPRPPAFDVGELARQPVATFGVLAPAGLQGFGPSLSQALATALAEAAPSVRGIPALETVNALNEQGLAAEYADLIAGFLRNGILERKRLQRIGSALRARYVLLPGLAEFDQVMIDRLAISGLKVVQSRVTTLRLWLQLWDAQTGRLLWESAGEATVASELLRPERTVPLHGIARKLWLRMIREGLLDRRSQ